MLRAVLFDWGDTLMRWAWDEDLVEAGHRAGLEAIGRGDLAADGRVSALFRESYLPTFWRPGVVEELEYPGQVRELLGRFGVQPSDDELFAFLEAEHTAWSAARQLGATTHALLESLRSRGLKLGLVSNAFDPGWLLHRDLADTGVAERVDFAVFSSEVGKRKPHPLIFETALKALEVRARRSSSATACTRTSAAPGRWEWRPFRRPGSGRTSIPTAASRTTLRSRSTTSSTSPTDSSPPQRPSANLGESQGLRSG
jgi:FMN phosphatase YigB (HAD superfamily)